MSHDPLQDPLQELIALLGQLIDHRDPDTAQPAVWAEQLQRHTDVVSRVTTAPQLIEDMSTLRRAGLSVIMGFRIWKDLRSKGYREDNHPEIRAINLEGRRDLLTKSCRPLRHLQEHFSPGRKPQKTASAGAPRWDQDERELWLGDTLLRRFNLSAPTQIAILEMFQGTNWKGPEAPDGYGWAEIAKAASRLNTSLMTEARKRKLPRTLHFRGDGTSDVLCWNIVPVSRRSAGRAPG